MSEKQFFSAAELALDDGYPTEAPSTESSDDEDFVVTWDERRGTLEAPPRRGGRVPPKRLRCVSVFEKDEKRRKRNGCCEEPASDFLYLDLRGGGGRRPAGRPFDDMEDHPGMYSARNPEKCQRVRQTTCECCDLAVVDETAACIAWRCGCEPASNLSHGNECSVCSSLDLSDVPLLA
ncbi:hypothetical protein TGPRC2_357300 [Toxoplasma gondii TgCatPRC2]|uniref:Uncharacterized protein n=1 Tax=Toxoplasma gondii TgCatPRC2 TaxID=1130821 RepID=A0A151HEQ7_TOXGO|nr:hypothetical protein TGPRC2_357300 [Toxoplasma gondii TgCatPRC2]